MDTPPSEMRCRRCDWVKPAVDFPKDRGRPTGRFPYCKACHRARENTRRAVNPTYVKALQKASEKRRRHRNPEGWSAQVIDQSYRFRYGIAAAEKQAILDRQNGRCAMCGTSEPGGKGFHLDHDHDTGAIRQCLCPGCNIGLGHLKDKPAVLAAGLRYLASHGKTLTTDEMAAFVRDLDH